MANKNRHELQISDRTVLSQYVRRYNKFRRINAIHAREPQPMIDDNFYIFIFIFFICTLFNLISKREMLVLCFDPLLYRMMILQESFFMW